jgi:hypothetical protein
MMKFINDVTEAKKNRLRNPKFVVQDPDFDQKQDNSKNQENPEKSDEF